MHIPVLLNEVLEYLDPKPGEDFIDCTAGDGGHSLAILKLNAPAGRVLAIDRDEDAIARIRYRAKKLGILKRLIAVHGSFKDVEGIARGNGFIDVKGVLFDLGLSSYQLEESGRGFSFKGIEPLDMRFDRAEDAPTAADILNSWPEASIARIIYEFGEEKRSRKIAKAIVEYRRKNKKIETTDELVGIISGVIPKKGRRGINSATRIFQALRIAVNSELEVLEQGIRGALSLLSSGERIAIISFHSLEDRRVKNIFKEGSASGLLRLVAKKPIRPRWEEIKNNRRARSAKLRVAEKI